MRRALALAARGLGETNPNPAVGCVVVRGGRVVGEGWHARAGGPHAEVVALRRAGGRARGATLYVTLEPCAHHGRTPPCAPLVRRRRASRGWWRRSRDPNPVVRGRGLALLRAAGVAVRHRPARRRGRTAQRALPDGRAAAAARSCCSRPPPRSTVASPPRAAARSGSRAPRSDARRAGCVGCTTRCWSASAPCSRTTRCCCRRRARAGLSREWCSTRGCAAPATSRLVRSGLAARTPVLVVYVLRGAVAAACARGRQAPSSLAVEGEAGQVALGAALARPARPRADEPDGRGRLGGARLVPRCAPRRRRWRCSGRRCCSVAAAAGRPSVATTRSRSPTPCASRPVPPQPAFPVALAARSSSSGVRGCRLGCWAVGGPPVRKGRNDGLQRQRRARPGGEDTTCSLASWKAPGP